MDAKQFAQALEAMNIRQLALEINYDPAWQQRQKALYAAVPYFEAMMSLDSLDDRYIADSGLSVVLYFLANAQQYRGDKARMIKAELKRRCDVASKKRRAA